MNQLSDEELMIKSREGNELAFKELVVRHEGKVAGVVYSMLGRTDEAMDVGQEVFIRFYKALNQFKGESTVGTYLVRIAINLSLNELKKRKRNNLLFTEIEAGHSVKSDTDSTDMKEYIAHELNQLDSDFRSVVTLRLVEGYTTEETATILNIPLGTVLSRLARAQKKLKTQLNKYMTS